MQQGRVVLEHIEVHYQPVIDLRTGLIVAAEALVRLRDQTTGALLPPSHFLPAAEASGQVCDIDRKVMTTAIPQLATWRADHPGRPLSLGLNVSISDLDDGLLPDRLATLAERFGVPCNALIIEVTETLPSVPGQGHERVLEQIAALDCNVTLDDFGTGFSSLSHLQRFPVHGIKVDKSFTQQLGEGERSDRVVRSLVSLGLDLGVHVVAEGIETADQLRALQLLGCPFGQGYLFSPAVPADQLRQLLHTTFAVGSGISRPRLSNAG